MHRILLSFFLFTFFFSFSQTADLSSQAEISVLTVGPGTYLQDSFGHSAYRIQDKATNTDITFGYGAYDFKAPNFYLKFAQGKLNYKLDVDYYTDFYENYARQNRTVKEQVLNLSPTEKQELFNYLLNNAKPENKFYLYDFFYVNCATKIRDVIQESSNNAITFNKPLNIEDQTFRDLIQDNLYWNSWGSFGIDLALGSVIDTNVGTEQYMFLPEYVYTFFNSATIGTDNKPLVESDTILFEKIKTNQNKNFFLSPFFVISLLSVFILYITYRDYKNKKRSKWLDVLIFSITGIIGIIMLLLWFATDHGATAHNYNLLWAFALNIFMIGQLLKDTKRPWFNKYVKFLIIMLCLLTLHWIIGVQVFTLALIPLLLALFIRYVYLIRV